MVQVTFDTNTDTEEELQHALRILSAALERRSGSVAGPVTEHILGHAPARSSRLDMPPSDAIHAAQTEDGEPAVETAVDTSFFKITLNHQPATEGKQERAGVPTLHQLLTDETLTEDELTRMFKETTTEPAAKPSHAPSPAVQEDGGSQDGASQAPYIEIVEYADEK